MTIEWNKGTDELENTIALACDADANDSRRNLPIKDIELIYTMVTYYRNALNS